MLRPTDHLRVIEFLKHFDCNAREAETYLQCLQLGPATVQEIAHQLKSNRITVHSTIEQIIQKGLLFETRRAKKRLIASESPDILHRILQQRYNEIKLIEHNLDYVTKILHTVHPSHHNLPTVKLYEESDGFKKMFEETLMAKNELLVFTCGETVTQLLPMDYLEDYYQRRAELGIHTKIIYPPCEFATKLGKEAKKYNINIRITKTVMSFEAGIYLWNNCLALKSFKDDKVTCTIIEHEDISNFFRHVIYPELWEHAGEITES